MEPITSNSTAISTASPAENQKKVAVVKALSGDFEKLLKADLSPSQGGQISEEELFAALLSERIQVSKGDTVAADWKKMLQDAKRDFTAGDGFVRMEDAAMAALKGMVRQGALTQEEGDQLFSEAFEAAQLDQNKAVLYDSRGGRGDPTVAMAALDVALQGARATLQKFIDGSAQLSVRSLSDARPNGKLAAAPLPDNTEANTPSDNSSQGSSSDLSIEPTPAGSVIDGAGGFLFKPVSNNENRLAVLLGEKFTGKISSVIIKDSMNRVIEEGILQSAGISETGREKYVFSKPGGKYPDNITVEVKLTNGSVQRYEISDPSRRYD